MWNFDEAIYVSHRVDQESLKAEADIPLEDTYLVIDVH